MPRTMQGAAVMLRLDVFEPDETTGDERLVAGLCYRDGRLQWGEGNRDVAGGLLRGYLTYPGDGGEILTASAADDPETWMRWAPTRASNAYQRVGTPYEDDDDLYDPVTGAFVGDASEKPLS